MFTKEHAREICEAHNIFEDMENEEEIECLEHNNPFLLESYRELIRFANGAHKASHKNIDEKKSLFPCGGCGFGLDLDYLSPGQVCPNCGCNL